MPIGTSIAIYFIIWWLVLFAVLPFGVRSQHEAGSVAPGTEPGAPARPLLWRKLLATTVIAAIVFAGFQWLRASGLTLDDIPLPGYPR